MEGCERDGIGARDGLTQNALLEDVLDAMPDSVAILDEGRILHINREFERFFGYRLEECVGLPVDDLLVPVGRLHENEIMLHWVETKGRATLESVRRTRHGDLVDVSIVVTRARVGSGENGLFVTYRDIGAQKQTAARLQHTALHDALTGLPNRALFVDRLSLTMARLRRRPDRSFAVLFLDVDRFKQVNDTFGHAAGDALLLTVAERLRQCLRPQDTVARFGGDEFAMLLDETGEAGDADRVAARIQKSLTNVIEIGAEQIYVSASIGIALGRPEYRAAEEILADADRAMYVAKSKGSGRHEIFGCRKEADATISA